MDLGPHAAFIWTSYAAVVVVVGALIAWLIHDGHRQRQRLRQLELRGSRRRSAGGGSPDARSA
jgi:heme exporter protein D